MDTVRQARNRLAELAELARKAQTAVNANDPKQPGNEPVNDVRSMRKQMQPGEMSVRQMIDASRRL